jgi:hypothetical protein
MNDKINYKVDLILLYLIVDILINFLMIYNFKINQINFGVVNLHVLI